MSMAKSMSPKKFANTLNTIEVRKITFVEISAKFRVENLTNEGVSVDSKNEVEIQVDEKSHVLAAFDSYYINAKVKDKPLFEIVLKLLVIFEAKQKPDKNFLKLFEQNTLKVITYPYVRHAVQDLTSKMGLEPLILPMWRVPAKADKDYLKPASNGHKASG